MCAPDREPSSAAMTREGPRASGSRRSPIQAASPRSTIASPHRGSRRTSPAGASPHRPTTASRRRGRRSGAPVLVAAQDERFLGGSAGANHAEALRALFHAARRERPAAVVLLMASGGVRLHEANPAELALARALAALLDLRAEGVPVVAIGAGDVFGGASVLACAADALALLPGTKFGLSGPKVIESTHGRSELDASNGGTVAALFGAEARAAAGAVYAPRR